ncbi:MAG: redoxin domain-containing protein [Verrucomicrobiota bacterium]
MKLSPVFFVCLGCFFIFPTILGGQSGLLEPRSKIQAKDFSGIKLKTATLEDYNLGRAVMRRNVVLIIYPGGWNPYGIHGLKMLRNSEQELNKFEFQTIAVTPDLSRGIRETLDKHQLPFVLLSDPEHQVARILKCLEPLTEDKKHKLKESGIDLISRTGRIQSEIPRVTFCFIGADGGVHRLWLLEDDTEIPNQEKLIEWAEAAAVEARVQLFSKDEAE